MIEEAVTRIQCFGACMIPAHPSTRHVCLGLIYRITNHNAEMCLRVGVHFKTCKLTSGQLTSLTEHSTVC